MRTNIAMEINLLDVAGIFFLLLAALIIQVIFHELPCPLCLLQRWGLLAIAFGFLLNVKFGVRPSHYGIAILSALYTAIVAGRQILLHIVPGTGGYAEPILGLHLYTWVFIICILIILFITFMLLFDAVFKKIHFKKNKFLEIFTISVFILIILITFTNSITTLLQCGIYACPDNPTGYQLLFLRYF